MIPPTDGISNWMHMFRWIVKLIRDEHGVDEALLVRSAVLEADCGMQIEDIEAVLMVIGTSFSVSFPPGALDEAAYQRTVDTLLAGGSDPVISAAPEGAWTHAITDLALQ